MFNVNLIPFDKLSQFIEKNPSMETQYYFWFGWTCVSLALHAGKIPSFEDFQVLKEFWINPNDFDNFVSVVKKNLGPLHAWLDSVAIEQMPALILSYDDFDKLTSSEKTTEVSIAALLNMWLTNHNRYQHLRGKIALRPKMFLNNLSAFPDASKLKQRSVLFT